MRLQKPYHILFILIAIVTVGQFATDVFLPSLPHITSEFMASRNLVQATISLYLISFGLSQLLYGPLSDRFGRRPVILLGIAIFLVGSLVCALAAGIDSLLLGRLIQGFGMGIGPSITRAIMRDSLDDKELVRAGALIGIAASVSPAIAPMFGGFLQHWIGWRASFGFLLIYASAIFVLVYLLLPETNLNLNRNATKIKHATKSFLSLLGDYRFTCHALIALLLASSFITYNTAAPFLFQDQMGYSAVKYGCMAIYIAVGFFIGSTISRYAIKRISNNACILLGMSCIFTGGFVLMVTGFLHILNQLVVMLPMLVIMIGVGTAYASASMGAIHPFANKAGSAASLLGCLTVLGAAFFSILISGFHVRTQLPMGVIITLISVLGFSILALLNFRQVTANQLKESYS